MTDLDLSALTKRKPLVLINDAYWEPKIKEWVPKLMINDLGKEQREIIVQKLLVVVVTPSNISRCSVCGKVISRGEYRIGVPEYDRRGVYGIINRWNHINPCSQKFFKKIIQGYNSNSDEIENRLSDTIYGWDTLSIGIKDEIVELSAKEEITQSNEYTINSSDDLINRTVVNSRPTPINLTYDLLQFQKEGLEWMCNQENSIARGGILADEMGMGKTIQTISLFLEHDIPPITDENVNDKKKKVSTGKNLVIAPVAAVLQWKQEIERFTKPGSLKVHVYHGSNRNKLKNNNQEYGVDIDQADVVITTYPTLEAEYRKVSSSFKYKCQYCDRSFLKRNLRLHLRYFCGPNARRTAKQALTERKSDGLKKAMNTLKIGLEDGVDKAKQLEEIAKSLPTISNVYREILAKADLLDDESLSSSIPWFVSRKRVNIKKGNNYDSKQVKEEEVDTSDKSTVIPKDMAAVKKKIKIDPIDKKENIKAFFEWGGIGLPLKKETLKSIKEFLSNIEASKDHLMNKFSLNENILNDLIVLSNNSKKQKKDEIIDQISNVFGIKDDSNPKTIKSETKRNKSKTMSRKNNNTTKKRKMSKNKDEYDYYEDDDDDYEVEDEIDIDVSDDDFEYNDHKVSRTGLKKRANKKKSESDDEYDYNDDNDNHIIEVENEEYNDEDIELEEEEIINKLKEYSGIFERKWYRIVLDEAHRIKARTTSTAKAIFSLTCIGTKWCLTGTPLQNRVGELYSLVRFIGYHPYAYYFCQKNDCNCRQLNYVSHMKYCSKCQHARSCHYSFFNKMIINPIKRYGFSGEGSEALKRLKNDVLDRVLLRRTKVQRQEDVKLPPLEIKVLYNELSPPEKDFYTSIYQRSKIKFDTFVNQGTVLHNYAHVFDLISRLRQAVDHPYLIVYGKFNTREDLYGNEDEQKTTSFCSNDSEHNEDTDCEENTRKKDKLIPSKSRASNNEDLCYICMDNVTLDQRVTSKCKHGFHIKCIKEYVEQAPQFEECITDSNMENESSMIGVLGCPVCYVPLTIDFNNILNNKNSSLSDEENDTSDNLESENQEMQIERDLERLEMAKKMGIIGNSSVESTSLSNEEKEDDILTSVRNKNIIRQIKTQGFESSTKIDRLIEEINRMMNEDPESKGIVFSQFTNMLDLVSYRLKKSNIGCVMLAGSMSILQRNSILYSFNKFPDLKIILISLKAGGEGLNLQVANYVFLLDPWWNPAVELQAFQRAHRIGQKKKVMAIRFITKDTIEERMFQLQEKKQLVFDGTVGASNNALNKLNSDDLKFLFQN